MQNSLTKETQEQENSQGRNQIDRWTALFLRDLLPEVSDEIISELGELLRYMSRKILDYILERYELQSMSGGMHPLCISSMALMAVIAMRLIQRHLQRRL